MGGGLDTVPFSTELNEVNLSGEGLHHITSVAVGGSATFVLNFANEVWAWGSGPLGGENRGASAGVSKKSMAAMSTAWNR